MIPTVSQEKGNAFFYFLIGFGMLIMIAGGLFVYTNKLQFLGIPISTPTVSPAGVENKPHVSPRASSEVPPSGINLFWGNYLGQTVLVVGERVYGNDLEMDPEIKDISASLVSEKAPVIKIPENHTIFSMLNLDQKRILFITYPDLYSTPASSEKIEQTKTAYLFDKNDNKTKELFKFTSGKATFPKIAGVSSDKNYLAFNLFSCWACGGHQPDTYLYSLPSGNKKNIGKTKIFEWLEDGKYRYKEYVVVSCPASQEGPIECSKDISSLPWKEGSL